MTWNDQNVITGRPDLSASAKRKTLGDTAPRLCARPRR